MRRIIRKKKKNVFEDLCDPFVVNLWKAEVRFSDNKFFLVFVGLDSRPRYGTF